MPGCHLSEIRLGDSALKYLARYGVTIMLTVLEEVVDLGSPGEDEKIGLLFSLLLSFMSRSVRRGRENWRGRGTGMGTARGAFCLEMQAEATGRGSRQWQQAAGHTTLGKRLKSCQEQRK